MIYILVHLLDYDGANVKVCFPIVPRVGERIILSGPLRNTIEENYKAKNPRSPKINHIENFDTVFEVAYNGEDGSIHIYLSEGENL